MTRFTIGVVALKAAVSMVSKVLISKQSLPILDCLKLSRVVTPDGGVNYELTGSDSATYITTTVSLTDVEGFEGSICMPAKLLSEALGNLSDQPITFEIDNNTKNCEVHYLNGHFSFVVQDAAEYPECSVNSNSITEGNGACFAVGDGNILEDINEACPLVSSDELRPVMAAVYIDMVERDTLCIVASDGHRLARIKRTWSDRGPSTWPTADDIPWKLSAALPGRVAAFFKSLPVGETVTVQTFVPMTPGSDVQYISFRSGDWCITTRVIEGRYPNYNSVIPKEHIYDAVINRKDLLGAIRRVNTFCSANSRLLRMEFNTAAKQCILSGIDMDFSQSAEERVPLTNDPQAEGFAIGFNGTFMKGLVDMVGETDIRMELNDPSRCAVIRSQTGNKEVVLLLMPMQLTE